MRMKMAVTGTGSWIKFFKDAGLPSSAAATYALTFTENRIRMDMLLDLNKEILKDMRINLMGDVIAILRHARRVHEQTECEKVLAGSPAVPSPVVKSATSVSGRSSPTNSSNSDSGNSSPNVTIGDTTPKQRLTPASRMVHHYVRQTEAAGPSVDKSSKVEVPEVKTAKVVTGIKRKVKTRESAPALKKVRRVLPEHEGRYKITMPSGSTPRTQQILAKQGLLPAKKTVFERLGEGSVSSTTGSDGPRITITGLGPKIVKNNVDKSQQSSVFSRLGDKQQVTSSTAPDLEEDDQGEEDNEPSPYAGVFKLPPKKTILVKKVPVSQKNEEATMRADAESSSVVKKKGLLHSRLGSGSTKQGGMLSTVVRPGSSVKTIKVVKKLKNKTAGILANPTNATKMSVKSRLGSSDGNSPVSTTASVKRKPEPVVFNAPSSSAVKSVSFGTVTQKTYLKEPVQSNVHPRVTMTKRPSVFGRLGT